MEQTILITGANGQLGKSINQTRKKISQEKFLFTDIAQLDITKNTEIEKFYTKNKFNIIVNCAGYTAVDKAETEPELAHQINTEGPKNLKNFAQKHNITFIHISTDYVFDGQNFKPYTENDKTNPQNIYGKTKLLGENAIIDYKNTIILRTSWLYSHYGNNFAKTIIKLAAEQKKINVVADQIGNPTYAPNLAKAILQIIAKIKTTQNFGGIYHFSDQGICSWYDFAVEITKTINSKCKIYAINSVDMPRPAKRPFYSALDKTKIKNKFKIQIPHWTYGITKLNNKITTP